MLQIIKSLLDFIPNGIVLVKQDESFLIWNKAAEDLVGLGPVYSKINEWSEGYGCYHEDGITPYKPEDLPLAKALLKRDIVDEVVFIKNVNHPNGIWLQTHAFPVEYNGEKMAGVVFIDINNNVICKNIAEKLGLLVSNLKKVYDDSSI